VASSEIRRVPVLAAVGALALCFILGFFVAGILWTSTRDPAAMARLCARVEYVNGLQENLKEYEPANEHVRNEFRASVEECRKQY
jgi:hypothetical protein